MAVTVQVESLGSMKDRHLAPAASEKVEIVRAMEIVRMIKS